MGKLKRMKKGTIVPLRLYAGRKTRETPAEVASLLEEFDDEGGRELEASELEAVVIELRQQIKDLAANEPVAITTNEDLAEVELGLIYVGPKKAATWTNTQAAIQLEEAKRLGGHRKAFKRESIPELYARGAMTAEGLKAYRELVLSVFRDAVAYADGVEGLERSDYEEAQRAAAQDGAKDAPEAFKGELVEWLEELDFGEQLRLMAKATELQSLRRSQTFPSTRARDVEAGHAAAA